MWLERFSTATETDYTQPIMRAKEEKCVALYMRRLSQVSAVALLSFALASTLHSYASNPSTLKKVADVPLPGPAVRFDYQSLDATNGRLYIAHMNANRLVVFDTKKRLV